MPILARRRGRLNLRGPVAVGRNVGYNLAGQALIMVLGFVAVKFQFSRLGADAFGIILFAQTLSIVLAGVLELGISATIVREVSAHWHDEPGYVVKLLRSAASIYWGGFLVLSGLTIAGAPFLVTHWIHLQTLDASTAIWMVRVLGVAALTALPRSLYANLFRGLQRMAVNNGVDVGAVVVQQLGVALILAFAGRIVPCVGWLALAYVLWLLAYLPAVIRVVPWIALLPGFDRAAVRRTARFSSLMTVITTLAMVHTQADKVAVSKLLPVSALGSYGFASTIVLRATLVANAVAEAALPSFSALNHRADRSGLQAQYRRLQAFVTLSTPALFALIAYFSLPLFTLLFNSRVAASLWLPVALLCLGQYMNGTLAVPNVFSIAVGQPQISARLNFVALFTVLPLTVVFVTAFGLTGAGLSWVAYHIFAYAYFVPSVCRQSLRISPIAWYRETGKVLALVAATYGAIWLFLSGLGATSIPVLLAGFFIASLGFSLGAYLLLREEIATLLGGERPIEGSRAA